MITALLFILRFVALLPVMFAGLLFGTLFAAFRAGWEKAMENDTEDFLGLGK